MEYRGPLFIENENNPNEIIIRDDIDRLATEIERVRPSAESGDAEAQKRLGD